MPKPFPAAPVMGEPQPWYRHGTDWTRCLLTAGPAGEQPLLILSIASASPGLLSPRESERAAPARCFLPVSLRFMGSGAGIQSRALLLDWLCKDNQKVLSACNLSTNMTLPGAVAGLFNAF